MVRKVLFVLALIVAAGGHIVTGWNVWLCAGLVSWVLDALRRSRVLVVASRLARKLTGGDRRPRARRPASPASGRLGASPNSAPPSNHATTSAS